MIPRVDMSVRVHRHGIVTTVRFWNPNESYTEFGIVNKDFPRLAFNMDNGYDIYKLCKEFVTDTTHDTFADFPYPAYLDIKVSFYDSDGAPAFEVVHAKYAESSRGIIDFTGSFKGKLITEDICRRVLENIFLRVANRDAEELIKTVERLHSVSGGRFVKTT